MKAIAYYPGSFDPLTLGHLDVLRQTLGMVDEVVIAIGIHAGKTSMFSFEERKGFIHSVVTEMDKPERVRVEAFDNLLVDAARRTGATLLVRGLRNSSDLDYELQLLDMNAAMMPQLNTVFCASSSQNRSISATLVRQIISMGGDVSMFVPGPVLQKIKNKFK